MANMPARAAAGAASDEKHPKGLYVLFATEMWERFSFYTMMGMLVLYMRDTVEGFGFTTAESTGIYSWYQMFVYATPLLGGWLADRFLGYRRSVMIGGVFFMVGHLLLAVPKQLPIFYTALACLVIGNGFFKPNVSSMVGALYREGSHLKDKAYLIFYMGINVGAFIAPIVAEFVKTRFGFHPAFAVASFGMLLSLMVFTAMRRHVMTADNKRKADFSKADGSAGNQNAVATAEDLPPVMNERAAAMDAVPEWKRIMALIVIFLIVIVFWMIFHQNGSTLTLWANDHTDWNVTGIISNSINPAWVIILALPLAGFWSWLNKKGLEPSTPTKIAIGMALTGLSCIVLYVGSLKGGYTGPVMRGYAVPGPAAGQAYINIPAETQASLGITAPPVDIIVPADKAGDEPQKLKAYAVNVANGAQEMTGRLYRIDAVNGADISVTPVPRVSPFWIVFAYFVISLGELMLSPMGLSLVSQVAPVRMRGLMMGGWFLATAIGNKLTSIGGYWDVWSHSKFFLVLASMAFAVAVLLTVLIRPLKKAMPGV